MLNRQIELKDLNLSKSDLLQYINEIYLPHKGHIVITATLLQNIFKNYLIHKNICDKEINVFPQYYHCYTSLKEDIHKAIYDYKTIPPVKMKKMMIICGSCTASGKTTYLKTLGEKFTTDEEILLDEYPVKDNNDSRLLFAKNKKLPVDFIFICRDTLLCAELREKRLLNEQSFKTYSTLSPREEAENFVENSIICTEWFVQYAKKKLENEPMWLPEIYYNHHGEQTQPIKLDNGTYTYYENMPLSAVIEHLDKLKVNKEDYIKKIIELIRKRTYIPGRMSETQMTLFASSAPVQPGNNENQITNHTLI
ncbi:MAG: hypothetical protein HYX60_02540 [Legionella longbeachae]|nr:hypothetical protein [Legionella longbeachae]